MNTGIGDGTIQEHNQRPEAAWDTFSTGYGPTQALAASLDPERREALRRDFIAFHAGFQTELGICVPREYWLTIGVRV